MTRVRSDVTDLSTQVEDNTRPGCPVVVLGRVKPELSESKITRNCNNFSEVKREPVHRDSASRELQCVVAAESGPAGHPVLDDIEERTE